MPRVRSEAQNGKKASKLDRVEVFIEKYKIFCQPDAPFTFSHIHQLPAWMFGLQIGSTKGNRNLFIVCHFSCNMLQSWARFVSRLRLLLFLRRFLGKLIAKLHFNCRRKICFRVVRAARGRCFDDVTKIFRRMRCVLGNLYQSVDSPSRFSTPKLSKRWLKSKDAISITVSINEALTHN